MVLNKKIRRTILEQKSQYIGSIILILISSMLFSAFVVGGLNIKTNLNAFRVENVLEDASFILQNKIEDISSIENKFILTLEERKSYDFNYSKDVTLRVLRETNKVDKYAVVNGHPLEKLKEILIDNGFAKAHHLKINDQVNIKNVSYHIVGYMTTPDYIYPLKSEGELLKNPDAFGIAVISKQDFNQFIKEGLTYYSVKFNQDTKTEFKDYLTKNNTLIKWVNKQDNNRISFVDGDVNGAIQMGEFFPTTILFLTIILVSTVLWRLLKREFTQIGTLYALGYRKREILSHYLYYPALLSFIGATTGTILGIIIIKPFLTYASDFYNLPIIVIDYKPVYLLVSFLLPFFFLIPSTIFIILRVLKMSPLTLMRGGANKKKVKFIERNLHLNRFKFRTKFIIREMVRNIPRTLLMVLGVMIASMLLLLGFATKDSMDYLIDKNYKDIYQYNYDYIYNSFQLEKRNPGDVTSFSPFTSDELNKGNKTFIIYGIEKNAKLIQLKDSKGRLLSFENTIITKPLADKLHLSPDDTLKVKNKLNTKEFSLKIDKIADSYIGDFIYLPLNQFNALNGYPKGSYLELMSTKKLNIDKSLLISSTSKENIVNGYQAMIKPLKYMIGFIGFTAFIIGLIVIYIVTSLMIEENKFNISLMKVLGYSKKEIFSLILDSSTWLVILGYLLSIPILLVVLQKYFEAMTMEMNIEIPTKLNYSNMIIGFVIIFVTYYISKLLNKKKIAKISMVESLKSKAE